jgi:hypothetical protein
MRLWLYALVLRDSYGRRDSGVAPLPARTRSCAAARILGSKWNSSACADFDIARYRQNRAGKLNALSAATCSRATALAMGIVSTITDTLPRPRREITLTSLPGRPVPEFQHKKHRPCSALPTPIRARISAPYLADRLPTLDHYHLSAIAARIVIASAGRTSAGQR